MLFGFNPEKALASAEKLVQQGKFAQAIELYEKVLPQQGSNLNLRNSLGDLYVRVGRNQDAVKLFREVADTLEQQGLTPRVVAVFKKILKLDPGAYDVQQRLAQLLVQQGAQNEAKLLLQSLAERAESGQDWNSAIQHLNQLVTLDPEQPQPRIRLAKARLNRNEKEPAQADLLAAAKTLVDKAEWENVAEVFTLLEQIDAQAAGYRLLQARSKAGQGDMAGAVAVLPAAELLGKSKPAAQDAWRVALDCEAYDKAIEYGRVALQFGNNDVAQQLGQRLIDLRMLDKAVEWMQGDPTQFRKGKLEPVWLQLISSIQAKDPFHLPSLEAWAELVQEDRNSRRHVRLRLAPAYVRAGELRKALECYRILVEEDPEDYDLLRELRKLQEQLGDESAPPAPAAPVSVEDWTGGGALSHESEPAQGEPASTFQTSAEPSAGFDLTPANANYESGSDKAWGGSWQEPAAAAHQEFDLGGAQEPAMNAGEFDRGFDTNPPQPELETEPVEQENTSEVAIEMDLSQEWADAGHTDLEGRLSEIEFYIANDLFAEADQAIATLFPKFPNDPRLLQVAAALQRKKNFASRVKPDAQAAAPAAPAPPAPPAPATSSPATGTEGNVAEFSFDSPAAPMVSPMEQAAEVAESGSVEAGDVGEGADLNLVSELSSAEAETEFAAEDLFGDVPLEQDAANDPIAGAGLGLEVHAELAGEAVAQLTSTPSPAAPTAPEPKPAGVLDDVFDNFRTSIEDQQSKERTDPESRYNMGVAYREMGLVEEALAELQKAFAGWKAEGGPAARMLSCGALIALSFQEAGMPELALQWYETTIKYGGLSQRDAIGPRFEAAKLLESMGRIEEALNYYRQVYAEDVDYHDVADCVRRLQKSSSAAN